MTKLTSEAEVVYKLCEKVMGWEMVVGQTGWCAYDGGFAGKARSHFQRGPKMLSNWHPLRSLADAFELADRFGGGYEIERRAGEDIPYFVSLWDAPNEGWYGGGITLQGAIVKAALASIGCEYEEQAR